MLVAIYRRFWLSQPSDEEATAVKYADNAVLATEKLALHHAGHTWAAMPEPYPDMLIECWTPAKAERKFLAEWERLRPASVQVLKGGEERRG